MIQFRHVSKTFPPDHCALRDIDLEISQGEFVFLTGANGAGKTTLLKLICRAEEPSAGEILLNGKAIAQLGRRGVNQLRRQIGLVFQEHKLLAGLSALENIALAAEAIGGRKKESRRKAAELLAQLGLPGLGGAKPAALSGGEKQRVALARALINGPSLILADEPTGNLDGAAAAQTMGLLRAVCDGGATVLIATHDLEFVNRYGTRVIALRHGAVDDDLTRMGHGSKA